MVTEEYVKRLIGRLLNYPWQEIELTSEPRIIFWRAEKPYQVELYQKPPNPPRMCIRLDPLGLMLWKNLGLSEKLAFAFSYPTFSPRNLVCAWLLTMDLSTGKARLEEVLRILDRALEKLSQLTVEDFKVKLLAEVLGNGKESRE